MTMTRTHGPPLRANERSIGAKFDRSAPTGDKATAQFAFIANRTVNATTA